MVRGSGKFKTKRGGGRSFSKNMVLDENGTAVAADKLKKKDDSDDNEDDEEAEGEEEDEDEDEDEEEDEGGAPSQPQLTRTERRELKKKQTAPQEGNEEEEDEEDPDLINPNHVKKKLNISDLGSPREMTRREREQKEKADAKDRYWKLHVQGKTEEAKADLARLRKIREEREAAQAKRKAEAEAKAAEIEAKKKAQQTKRAT